MFSDSDKRFTNDLSIRLFVVLISNVRQLSLKEEDDRSLGVVEEGGRVLLFLLLMETKTDSLLKFEPQSTSFPFLWSSGRLGT
jgi:hypothetical protein